MASFPMGVGVRGVGAFWAVFVLSFVLFWLFVCVFFVCSPLPAGSGRGAGLGTAEGLDPRCESGTSGPALRKRHFRRGQEVDPGAAARAGLVERWLCLVRVRLFGFAGVGVRFPGPRLLGMSLNCPPLATAVPPPRKARLVPVRGTGRGTPGWVSTRLGDQSGNTQCPRCQD